MSGTLVLGFTTTLRIREYAPTREVPVMVVTAHDTDEFRAAAVAVGRCEYIVKPLDFEQLDELLDRFLPTRRRAQDVTQD